MGMGWHANSSFVSFRSITLGLALTGLAAHAVDLDYRTAKSNYDRQRVRADGAKTRYQNQAQQLSAAESRLSSALREEQQAREDLNAAQNNLTNLDQKIRNREIEISNQESDRDRYAREVSNYQSEVNSLTPKKDRAERELEREKHKLRDVEQKIRELEKDAPDSPQLPGLKSERTHIQSHIRQLDNELWTLNSQLSSAQSNLNSSQDRLDRLDRDLRENRANLAADQRDRDRLFLTIGSLQDAVRRAQTNSDDARRNVDNLKPFVLQAKADWDKEEAEAADLYAYYQQVVANYNAALNDVYAKADRVASGDSLRESTDRAPVKGKADGAAVGSQKGNRLAAEHISQRDFALGYADGMAKASTDPTLDASYRAGNTEGERIAREKALAENYPLGYNRTLKDHLAALPATTAQPVDLSESIPSDPGGSGNFLSLADKSVGKVDEPGFTAPSEPVYGPPQYEPPTVAVPGSLKTYFDPSKPCTGLVLAEFEPMCTKRYEQTYLASFDSNYQRIYKDEYRPVFTEKAKESYDAAIATGKDPKALANGRATGANNQGVLDGFKRTIDPARIQADAEGVAALKADLKTGALLVLREVKLEETTGDGLFTPGESAKLTLVIDNYGHEASALAKARVKVAAGNGLGTLNFALRDLPSLPGGTRSTLQGVVAAPITSQFAGESIALDAKVEIARSGQWVALGSLAEEAETHYPLEIVAINYPRDPKLNEEVPITVQFKNLTQNPISATPMKLGSSPGFVTFAKPDISVPAVDPGQTADVTLNGLNTKWIPENGYVRFTATNPATSELAARSQPFAKDVHVDRSASLLLFDANGKPIPSSTLTVKAGENFSVITQFAYHAKTRLPGPFYFRYNGVSHPGKILPVQVTTSVPYSPSPGQKFQGLRHYFRADPSLKGVNNVYVTFSAIENGTERHVLVLYLNVK